MTRFRVSLLTLALLLLVSSLTAAGQGSKKKSWPVQTKGQEGLRAPQERATLPVPIPGVRDRATGLWQDVTLKATGPVRVGDVQVVTRLPLPDTTRATVNIHVPLTNETGRVGREAFALRRARVEL